MSDLESYELVLSAVKQLVKCEKARMKKSESFLSMDIHNYSTIRRARASDRLTDACFEVDKAKDYLHKALVDACLAPAKSPDSYETRLLTHSAGFGHSVTFKYTPPIPNCIKC